MLQFAQQRIGRLQIAAEDSASRADFEGLGRQGRPEAVVQITAQPPALLLAGKYQLLARVLEFKRQTYCVSGDTRLTGQVAKKAQIAGVKRLGGRSPA